MSRTSNVIGLGFRKIAVVALDGAYPGSLTGVVDVVQNLNRHTRNRVARALPGASTRQGMLAVKFVSLGDTHVTTFGNLRFAVDATIASSERFDVVILPSFRIGPAKELTRKLASLQSLTPWLQKQQAHGAVFAAHCAGIVLLAEAGLLDQHTATIPLSLEAAFRRRYPKVQLDLTQSIVHDRNTVCAAALADNLRLVWRVLQQFRSGFLSEQSALDLFFHDAGMVGSPAHANPTFDEWGDPLIDHAKHWLARWLSGNLSGTPDLSELARELSVSERTLFRRFKAAAGMTPNTYLQRLRVESAKALLQRTQVSIDKVAARVGYSNRTYFSKLFRKYSGVTPHAFRIRSRG